MRIALVHDQIAEFGGAERVLVSLKKAYPDADVYTSFVDKKRLGSHWRHFEGWRISQSWAAKIPFFSKLYSPLRFLLPLIWRSFDLSSYDMVICSSSWGMCKGVSLQKKTYKSTLKTRYVCYLHTPPRYLYGYDESSLKKYLLVRIYALVVNHFLRQYDFDSSQTIDQFIFNSEEVRGRSLKFYRKDGTVIHPPILGVQGTGYRVQDEDSKKYYLTVSRLAPTKHIDVIVQAANKAGFNLKIVGIGKEYEKLKSMAGPTVELVGSVTDEQLTYLYAHAKAFIYASVNEDFGMVPVEAMAYGTPVIAFNSGGVKETVISNKNGILYDSLAPEAIVEKTAYLEGLSVDKYQSMCAEAYTFAKMCSEQMFIDSIQKLLAIACTHEA